MRKFLLLLAAFAISSFLGAANARTSDHGTKEEAKAMAEHAASFLKSNGVEKALAAFNQGSDGFKDRDLYVFVYDNEGVCLAQNVNLAMVGKNLIGLKDADGKSLIRDFLAIKDAAWVDYVWKNPQTQQIQPKSSYIVRVGNYILGVGAYVAK
jgi:cytochrome c